LLIASLMFCFWICTCPKNGISLLIGKSATSVRLHTGVSLSNDDEAKALAESYGASALLDKMSLYHQLVPAIMQCSPSTHADHGDAAPETLDAD
jgi:hypothetical protein